MLTTVGTWLATLTQTELIAVLCIFCPFSLVSAFMLGWAGLAATNRRQEGKE